MDPVSHVLFGRTLLALDRGRRLGPRAAVACGLGALAPDVDAVYMARGWDSYLRVHEIGTHSILGGLVAGSAAAALIYVLLRRGLPYLPLMLAAWIGALSHLTFDLLSGATMKPGWPLLPGRLRVPLVAMADPWLVAICVAGAIALWVGRRRTTTVAVGVLLAIGMFLTLKALFMVAAVQHWDAARGSDPIAGRAVEAVWGSLTEWHVFDRTPHALRKWRVDALGDTAALILSVPLGPESRMVAASRSLETVQNFLHVHELGFAVPARIENGGTRVLWSDIRYCEPEACALWFGGVFDRQGRPVTQIVHVGEWRQTRAVAP